MTISVYQINDLVRLTGAFFDIAGDAVDPSTVTLHVTPPSGVTVAYTYALAEITKDTVGNYHKDVTITASGQWFYSWSSTGPGAAAEHGEFMVSPGAFVVAV